MHKICACNENRFDENRQSVGGVVAAIFTSLHSLLSGRISLFATACLIACVLPATSFGDVAKGVFAASSGKATVTVNKVTALATGNLQSDVDTLVYKYTFPAPTFEEHDDGTATVIMNGVENGGEAGYPSLPILPVRLAIPKGRALASVEYSGDMVKAATGVVLRHVSRPVPTSMVVTGETERAAAVYQSDDPFPEKCFNGYNVAGKRGVKFMDLALAPVKYKGVSGEVWYYPEITIVLILETQGTGAPQILSSSLGDAQPETRSEDDVNAALRLLDNPAELKSYVPANALNPVLSTSASALSSSVAYSHPTLPCTIDDDFPGGYRHVIITSQALLSAFEQLVMYRRGQGVSSTAVTVERIASAYSGVDTQEKIRNFIKDAYTVWNTEYVVLGGDTGHVPARSLYCRVDSDTEDVIPSDMYYQCLDGDFNADGDSIWGEANDNVDWYAEVAIGRVSAESVSEVNNWYSKLAQYNSDVANDAGYTHRMLAVGEDMNSNGSDWGSSRWASVFLEEVRIGGSYNGYATKGFDDSSSYTTRDTLYDSANYTWQASDLISKINANKYAVIHHLGHGNFNWNLKLSPTDVDNKIKNTSPLFVYSWACISGAIDKDCIAEHFLTSSRYGCFGGVWNSRYGWGCANSTDGKSQRLARHFWNAAFTVADTKNGTTGLANQLSHERNASYASSDSYFRWVIYETNLFGDPIQQIDGVTLTGSRLNVSKPSVSFSAAGGSGSADVTASSSWAATASHSWISLNTTSGNGNGTITYSVSANSGTSERTGTITVRSGGETAIQRITQSAEAARLSVSPTINDLGCSSGSGSFAVQANYSWTVENSVPWITLGTSGGIGNGTVSYSVSENTGASRTGSITVRIGSLTAVHTVTQTAQAQLSIDPQLNIFSAAAGSGTITVTSDSSWTVLKSGSWITLGRTSGNGNGTIPYSVSENTGSKREGWIYVKSGSVQRSFRVTQNRAEEVTFSEESASVSDDGGTGSFTVTVLADNWVVGASASMVDWASWTWSSAAVTGGCRYTFNYTIRSNSTIEQRTVKIPIVFNGTTYYFTIVQSPRVNNFLVTYKPGANGIGFETCDVKKKNVALTLRGALFTRAGHAQLGWATSDGGGKVYDLGASYTKNAALTLYPYWEAGSAPNTTYTLRFSPGPYGTGSEQTVTKYKGTAVTLPGALYTREGYEQTGWSVFSSGSSKTYELGGRYANDVATTFYPYWTETIQEQEEYSVGFFAPSGWENSLCLSTTNLAAGSYAPQYVFAPGSGLVLNYCVGNYSETAVTFDDRHMSLWDSSGNLVESQLESDPRTISYQSYMRFRNRDLSSWLSAISPGNYALKVNLDPSGKLNESDTSDNTSTSWFAVKAEGITLNEALDCSSLDFTDDGTTAFPQTSESVVGGSCVQLGPQPTNSYDSAVLWVYANEPGTLTFKWKATSQNGYKAYLGCFVNGELVKYTWATEQAEWEEAFVTIDTAPLWVCWRLGTYQPDADYLTAGWVDCVSWSGDTKKPVFTVDSNGTLTAVQLNGATDIQIPAMVNGRAVRAIGSRVFEKTDITSVLIPDSITNIADEAFHDCEHLKGVTIPGSVKSIGDNAFSDCLELKSVVFEEGLKDLGTYSFYACLELAYVKIPASVSQIGTSPFGGGASLWTIEVAEGNTRYATIGSSLVDKTTMELLQYPMGRTAATYEVPEGIVGIGFDSFDWATNLVTVTLPGSVNHIAYYAFLNCWKLTAVNFRGNAPDVDGDEAFEGVASTCRALVSPQSTGWGVSIPGTWYGIGIQYSAALQTYSVTYNPGTCGTGSLQSETKQHGVTLPLKGAVFSRTGYMQTGWATSDGGGKVYELGASYTANSPVTLYPYWTANSYAVTYELDGGTAGAVHPTSAAYGTAFRVSAPSKSGYAFTGWTVTSGLDISTARYGESASNLSVSIDNAGMECFTGSDADVWFINLTPKPDGEVVLAATWEAVADDSRDIGFYAPANKGWTSPICLSSTNIAYLAYAPETEFEQFSEVYLSFCAVNWNRYGTALLQSTLVTIADEGGNVVDVAEFVHRCTMNIYGYHEFRNISLRRYLRGARPGRYKITAQLDPNEILSDPDRSNNVTSIWFTVTAPADPIPALPEGAYRADIVAALEGSADAALAENIQDTATYSAYREWAQSVKTAGGRTLAGKQAVKDCDNAWFLFAIDSSKLIDWEIAKEDVRIDGFTLSPNGDRFDLTVGIADVEVGAGAISERLQTVFDVESAARLDESAFSDGNLVMETAAPENGKVKLTLLPAPLKTRADSSNSVLFMRVKVHAK